MITDLGARSTLDEIDGLRRRARLLLGEFGCLQQILQQSLSDRAEVLRCRRQIINSFLDVEMQGLRLSAKRPTHIHFALPDRR